VSYSYNVPLYESADGTRHVLAVDAERAELRVAVAMAERRHSGPEGLRFMRAACGIRLKSMAEAMGVDERTIRRWEKTGAPSAGAADVAAYYEIVRRYSQGDDPLSWLREAMVPLVKEGDTVVVDAA